MGAEFADLPLHVKLRPGTTIEFWRTKKKVKGANYLLTVPGEYNFYDASGRCYYTLYADWPELKIDDTPIEVYEKRMVKYNGKSIRITEDSSMPIFTVNIISAPIDTVFNEKIFDYMDVGASDDIIRDKEKLEHDWVVHYLDHWLGIDKLTREEVIQVYPILATYPIELAIEKLMNIPKFDVQIGQTLARLIPKYYPTQDLGEIDPRKVAGVVSNGYVDVDKLIN